MQSLQEKQKAKHIYWRQKMIKRKIKRIWRHFKYWLVRRLMPEGDSNFLVVPSRADIKLTELTAEKIITKDNYESFGDELIKAMLADSIAGNIKKHLHYEKSWDGEFCKCKGSIVLARK